MAWVMVLFTPLLRADSEQFVTPSFRIGTLELQCEASVYSSTITLKQVCRWSREDDPVFQSVADLIVARFADQSFTSIKADDILNILQGAGLTPAAVRFTGSAACTVSRVDQPIDRSAALLQWTRAADQSKSATQPALATEGTAPKTTSISHGDNAIITLEDALTHDLASRLQLPADMLQIQFDPRDDKLLSMTNPPFTFEIAPNRVHTLGNVSWDLTIRAGRTMQSAHIAAYARAWQNQVLTASSLQFNQIIRPGDLTEQRLLVDSLPGEPLLTRAQATGQQAAMSMKMGTVLTTSKVAAVPLIRNGELVTVKIAQGNISLQTQARALESAAYGQAVRLRNETTHDIFEAIASGPQQADMK